MSDFWLINGWRQQSRSTREIDGFLRRARERGFRNYALSRQGRDYWLVCGTDTLTRQQYDLALLIRRTFARLQQAMYLTLWQGQVVCVAWQGDRLQHCFACQHDAEGRHHLELVLQRMRGAGKGQPTLIIAKHTPDELVELCRAQLCHWRLLLEQAELRDLQPLRSARLRSIEQRPPWQQRQRILGMSLALLVGVAGIGYLFWPQADRPVATEQLTRRLADPAGVTTQLLQELPGLFEGFRYLAGWQWRSAQLQGNQLQAVVVPSYGRSEELAPQLPDGWVLRDQGQHVSLQHLRFSEALAPSEQASALSDTPAWVTRGAKYFPELTLQAGTNGQDSSYRWRQWQLRLANTDFSELSRLAALLQQSNLRITSLSLQNGKQLQVDLTVRVYEPIPISQGERTS